MVAGCRAGAAGCDFLACDLHGVTQPGPSAPASWGCPLNLALHPRAMPRPGSVPACMAQRRCRCCCFQGLRPQAPKALHAAQPMCLPRPPPHLLPAAQVRKEVNEEAAALVAREQAAVLAEALNKLKAAEIALQTASDHHTALRVQQAEARRQ